MNADVVDRVREMQTRIENLEGALRRIKDWEMPRAGDGTQTFAWYWGANGERAFVRSLAADALGEPWPEFVPGLKNAR